MEMIQIRASQTDITGLPQQAHHN